MAVTWIFFILLVVLVAAVIFVYRLIYTYKINKMIQAGEVKGRKLVDLHKMVMGAVIVGLTIFAVMLMCIIYDYENRDYSISRNNYAVIDISDEENYRYYSYFGNTELEDASFAKVYKKDANEGYEKEVIESENYIYTVFRRTAPADSFHPDFLCFVEFLGTDDEKYVCYTKTEFHEITEETGGFAMETGGKVVDNVLYIGYLEQGCKFDITMSLLDDNAETQYNEAMEEANKEDNGDFPTAEEYAVSTGSVSISFDE